jgi:hypothetical protein
MLAYVKFLFPLRVLPPGADVYLQNETGYSEPDPRHSLPAALLFVDDSKVSVAFGNGIESSGDLAPIKPITNVPPISKASDLKPPLPSYDDAWFVQTRKVRWKPCDCCSCRLQNVSTQKIQYSKLYLRWPSEM